MMSGQSHQRYATIAPVSVRWGHRVSRSAPHCTAHSSGLRRCSIRVGPNRRLDSIAKQTRVAILADLFPVLGPHTRAKTLYSIELHEIPDRLIDGGGFAALHQSGMFDSPAPAVSLRIVPSPGSKRSGTPFRALDVSERAKLCQNEHGRWKRQGDSRIHPPGN